jgi:hypothetical protein
MKVRRSVRLRFWKLFATLLLLVLVWKFSVSFRGKNDSFLFMETEQISFWVMRKGWVLLSAMAPWRWSEAKLFVFLAFMRLSARWSRGLAFLFNGDWVDKFLSCVKGMDWIFRDSWVEVMRSKVVCLFCIYVVVCMAKQTSTARDAMVFSEMLRKLRMQKKSRL